VDALVGWSNLDRRLHAFQQPLHHRLSAAELFTISAHATVMDLDGQVVVLALKKLGGSSASRMRGPTLLAGNLATECENDA